MDILTNTEKPKASDEVSYVYDGWKRAEYYHRRNIDNCIENWRFYWAKNSELGLGQWPAEAVSRMTQQGRQLVTYNFIMPIVDGLAGSIMKTPFDPEFIPIGSPILPELKELTSKIKKIMYSDKELLDWKTTYMELLTHGLIHEGVIKMVISNEYTDLGNIGFETCLPGTVISDPHWKSWSSKDCKRCWKESWYTAEELMEIYPHMADRLKFQAKIDSIQGTQYGINTGIIPYNTSHDVIGSLYRVIEEYVMVKERLKSEYVITEKEHIQIPDMPDDAKPKWLNENIDNWNWDFNRIYEESECVEKCKVRATVMAIIPDKLLEDSYTEIQVGRLPYFWWSASRFNGEPHSIVDSIKDPQMNLNYAESLIQYKLATEGGGGAQLVDETEFVDNKEFKKFCKYRGRSSYNFRLKPGSLSQGRVAARPVVNSPYPSELYKNVDHIIDKIFPNTSKVVPATIGRPEPGNPTSGKLFQLMKLQSDNLTFTIHLGVRLFWNDVYEAFFLQSVKQYSNEDLPRIFSIKDEEDITLNKRVQLADGSEGIENQMSLLRDVRAKVIISESQESPTDKMNNVAILSEYNKTIDPNLSPLTKTIINGEIAKNIDQFPKDAKDKLDEAQTKELELAQATIDLNIANVRMQQKQIEMQMSQIGGQPPMPSAETPDEAPPVEAAPGMAPETVQNLPEGVSQERAPETLTQAPAPQGQEGVI